MVLVSPVRCMCLLKTQRQTCWFEYKAHVTEAGWQQMHSYKIQLVCNNCNSISPAVCNPSAIPAWAARGKISNNNRCMVKLDTLHCSRHENPTMGILLNAANTPRPANAKPPQHSSNLCETTQAHSKLQRAEFLFEQGKICGSTRIRDNSRSSTASTTRQGRSSCTSAKTQQTHRWVTGEKLAWHRQFAYAATICSTTSKNPPL